MTDHWASPTNYSFPVTVLHNKKRKFQRQWLEAHKWLVYSPSVDGAFCKCCFLFATSDNLGKFVTDPFRNWNKASSEFNHHHQLKYHEAAQEKAELFVSSMKKVQTDIKSQLDAKVEAQIHINRQVLASIIQTVLLCGRQGLALRGNNDDGILQEDNVSNFNALLKFRIDAGDELLRKHLQSCSSNATYVSKKTQNNLINIIGEQIRDRILAQVKAARHFTLLADEATDSGNWEQLSFVLRFVDAENKIHEDFLQFLPCDSITGEALSQQILQCLQDWGLEVGDIRGQGYDGAANMAGKFKGVQARILTLNEKALYFHCAAHCLSLCVVKSCQVVQVKNMLTALKDVAAFFNFAPKRQRKLEVVLSTAFPDKKKQKMVDLCKTRWVEKHTAFETFADLYQVLFDCLGQITEDSAQWDGETVTKAAGYLHCLSTGNFLVAFVVTRKCLQYLKPLTVNLQKKAQDICAAYREITDLTNCIQELRRNVDAVFPDWFQEANGMSQALVQSDIQPPRRVGRQVLRDNQPADNPEDYYKRSVAIPFLDHLSRELTDRFKNADLAKDGLLLVPVNTVQQYPQGCITVPDGIRCLATLWEGDLSNIDDLDPEFKRWCSKWCKAEAEGNTVPGTIAEALLHCDSRFYPNLHRLLRLLCTLPITTSECERSISRLRMLKTYLRSTMGKERLNGLALMRIHRNVPVDITAAIDTFSVRFRTRMSLLPATLLNM